MRPSFSKCTKQPTKERLQIASLARYLRLWRLYGNYNGLQSIMVDIVPGLGEGTGTTGAHHSADPRRQERTGRGRQRSVRQRRSLLMALRMQACPASSNARCLPLECMLLSCGVGCVVSPTSLLPSGRAHDSLYDFVLAKNRAMQTCAPARFRLSMK